jgi:NitT/TauT family transport system substrate-binding protein
MAKKITSDIAGGAVFSLPWLVGRDEGLFADEGLEVELVRSPQRSDAKLDFSDVVSTGNHLLFEQGEAQFQRGCEWGQLRRAYDSKVKGRVISKRAAVVSQAVIVSAKSPYTHPEELSNVPVATHYHAGSQYMTLRMLEGFLPHDQIKTTHVPVSARRYKALLDNEVGAITVPEPWISLAEKQGCKVMCEAFCIGSEVASPEIDSETYAAIQRAIKKAVRFINESKKRYLHYFSADVPLEIGALKPADLHLARLRYVDPAPYPLEEFNRACQWMWSRGLIPQDATFDQLVDNRISMTK